MSITRRTVGVVALGALAASVTSCSGPSDVVESARWVIEESPTLAIGVVEGDAPYLFEAIVHAELLEDGGVIVADGGASAIRLFDATGAFVLEMGGEGSGPGEFRGLRDAWIVGGDTVVAWDSDLRRLTYFERTGVLVRTVLLEAFGEASGVGGLDLAVGPLEGGEVAIASLGLGEPAPLRVDRVSVELFGADGSHMRRVGEATGMVRFTVGERGSAPVPFTPFPRFDVHGSSIYFTNGDAPSLTVWSEGVRRVIELPPVEHDVDAAWSELSERLGEEGREVFAGLVLEAPRREAIPHLAGLILDAEGQIWTKPYVPMADALWLNGGANRWGDWWVVDESGARIAEVSVPDGFDVMDVRSDVVVGVAVDADGVERVQVHRLGR